MMEIQYDSRYVRDKYGNFLYRTNTTDMNSTKDEYGYNTTVKKRTIRCRRLKKDV